MEIILAIFWHKFNALFVDIVVTVVALKALLEETSKELFAILTDGWTSVSVNLEGVGDFHALLGGAT